MYQERKSLRHQLLTMRHGNTGGRGPASQKKSTMSNVFNNSLLNIYINTVKTGSQDEIEQFSQIEKQKLVQLLSTNNELLAFMFDKMFKNMKKDKRQKGEPQSHQDLLDLLMISEREGEVSMGPQWAKSEEAINGGQQRKLY